MRQSIGKLIAIFSFCLFLLPVFAFAQTTEELQSELRARQSEIDSINKKIADSQKQLESLTKQQAGLQNDLKVINGQVNLAELDISSIKLSLEAERLQLSIIDGQVRDRSEAINRQKSEIAKSLIRLRKTGQLNAVEIIFSSGGLYDALSSIDNLKRVNNGLEKSLSQTKDLKAQLEVTQNEQQTKLDELDSLNSELTARLASLQQKKNSAAKLLDTTKGSEAQYKVLMSELRQEQSAITSKIVAIQDSLKARIRNEEGSSASDTTTITSPLKSYVITAVFHDPTYPFRNLFPHTGLDMAAPSGTPIYAAAPGVVTWVRSGSTGYGNYVMIVHDNGIATLYGHMSQTATTQDKFVQRGELIGYVGTTGFSTGPHLHFEVRLNGIPVNPQEYLQN